MTLALTLAAAVAIGVTLGLFGGGGSILTVPVLIYVAGIEPKQAIAMSLFVVAVTALVGAVPHARASRVRWRTGLLFGGAGMAGAYAGGRLAAHIPATALLIVFAVVMAVTALAMLRSRSASDGDRPVERPVPRILAEGMTVGVVTGLVGAGGGFLIVPALVLLGGLTMPVAVGTSLMVIAMKSFAGLAGYLHSVQLDWSLTVAVTGAAVLGGLAGSWLAGRLDPLRLRRAFGWFVLVMAGVVLVEQVPAEAWQALFAAPGGWAVLTAVPVAAAAALLARRRRRHGTRRAAGAGPDVSGEGGPSALTRARRPADAGGRG